MFDLNEAQRMARAHAREHDQIGVMLGLAINVIVQLQTENARLEAENTRLRAALEGAAVREALAAYAHEAWAGWMRYLFSQGQFNDYDGTWSIPRRAVERWTRQLETPYADLPGDEKDSDRKEADAMLAIVRAALAGPGGGEDA